jgi:hypothetical protein
MANKINKSEDEKIFKIREDGTVVRFEYNPDRVKQYDINRIKK